MRIDSMINEKDYEEILEKIRDRYWELSRRERRKYIDVPIKRTTEVLLKKATKGDEDELKQLFEIGKEKDIPKNLKYSYDNLIEALLNASNLMGLDNLDA